MPSALDDLLARLGPEIEDPDEETFLLFASERPHAQNLGFVDAHAAAVELTVAGRDLVVHQSPAVLTSQRAGGTTGAVLWKITPAVAEWFAQPGNPFFTHGLLGPESAVLELGCGISGLIGLALTSPRSAPGSSSTRPKTRARRARRQSPPADPPCRTNTVARYVMTDQPYVARLVQRNLDENAAASDGRGRAGGGSGGSGGSGSVLPSPCLYFRSLDWETDIVSLDLLRAEDDGGDPAGPAEAATAGDALSEPTPGRRRIGFDAVVACDCVYNEALVAPLVQTCVDACRLRPGPRSGPKSGGADSGNGQPTLCIVAQQLREPDVLTTWLTTFYASFQVWRVPETELPPALWPKAGFVIHVGILRH